jgi:hypothetical protein
MTTLAKSYPHVDKVCDATFLKKATGLQTKKDATQFILNHPDAREFFSRMNEGMVKSNKDVQEKISKYLSTLNEDLNKFKKQLKFVKEQDKINKKNSEREALKAEIRREMEREEKEKQEHKTVRESLGMPIEKINTEQITPDLSPIEPVVKTPIMTETNNTKSPTVSPSQSPKSLELTDFYKFMNKVNEMGLLKCQTPDGTPVNIQQISFNETEENITMTVDVVQVKKTLSIE